MARLFISASRLEAWSVEGRAALDADKMTLVELDRTFTLKAAVRFTGVIGGDADPHQLIGLVKDEDELSTMGADHMADSVIYADTGYEVQQGFVGLPNPT